MKTHMVSRIPLPLIYFLGIWVILNAFQAWLTPLDPDEAYYWIYSQFPAWGYFDHPPMVALMIKAGSSWLPGAIGLRMITVLFMPLTLLMLWQLADRPEKPSELYLFLLLAAAMPFFHVYGFVATPDAPLLFFSAAWFLAFRKFLASPNMSLTLILGILMALLLYSKYHGVLVIGFSVLANLRLLRMPYFWLSGIFGLVLFIPHLYWQYAQGFPTFAYHLVGRDDEWEIKLPLNYLLNQALIFSPLLFPFLLKAIASKLTQGRRSLEVALIAGFWLFFAAMTFKGHVEPQWTAVLSIPVVLLLHEYVKNNELQSKLIRNMALVSVFLMVLARLGIMTGLLRSNKLFGNTDWVLELQEKAMGLPLYFENSYRDAAMYAFYTGTQPSTFTNIDYRANQYNLLDLEIPLHNQRVMVVGQRKWNCSDCRVDTLSNGHIVKLLVTDSLQVSENCRIIVENIPEIWAAGDTLVLDAVIENPYPFDIQLGKGNLPLSIGLLLHDGEKWVEEVTAVYLGSEQLRLVPKAKQTVPLRWVVPKVKGTFKAALGFRPGNLLPAVNSDLYLITIE
jgi:hypothetical protein